MKTLTKQRIITVLLSIVPAACYLFLTDITSAMPLFFENNAFFTGNYHLLALIFSIAVSILTGFLIHRNNKAVRFQETITFRPSALMPALMLALFLYAASQLILTVCSSSAGYAVYSENWQIQLSVLLLCPIAEELLFRYFALEMNRDFCSAPTLCFANGLLFALTHMSSVQSTVTAFLMGAAMAYVYLKTKNLWCTILAHVLFNLTTLVPQFGLGYHVYNDTGYDGAVWFGIQAVLLAIPVIWFFVSFRKNGTVDSGANA